MKLPLDSSFDSSDLPQVAHLDRRPDATELVRMFSKVGYVAMGTFAGPRTSAMGGSREDLMKAVIAALKVRDEDRQAWLDKPNQGAALAKILKALDKDAGTPSSVDIVNRWLEHHLEPVLIVQSKASEAVVLQHDVAIGRFKFTAKPTSGASGPVGAGRVGAAGALRTNKTPKAFSAYPRMKAPAALKAATPFDVEVGFSATPDAANPDQAPMNIRNAKPTDRMMVALNVENGWVTKGPSIALLKLDLAESRTFNVTPAKDVDSVTITASFYFKDKLLGMIAKTATRRVAKRSTTMQTLVDDPTDPTPPPSIKPLADPQAIKPVDLRLHIDRKEAGKLVFTAFLSGQDEPIGPYEQAVEDELKFARDLADLRELHGDSAKAVPDEMSGIGAAICACIPDEILERAIAPALKRARAPSILILTNIAQVPWELAWIQGVHNGRGKPAFLAELARIGRWWLDNSQGPASQLDVLCMSAVAADSYEDADNREELEHAREERDHLSKRFKAEAIKAVGPDIDEWLDRSPRRPGHLAHLAMHGYFDAGSDRVGLNLGDGAILTPNRLAGTYDETQIPRFAAVFLNACQVGVSANALGQKSGFPGALTRAGSSAFIAPLWEVEDKVASSFAESFYDKVFDAEQEVGEALRLLKVERPDKNSITPWAYQYYGHPCLRIDRSKMKKPRTRGKR
ncbi:hypothetical protein BH10PSE17_BH10PSE17_03530 [soil metagenome]